PCPLQRSRDTLLPGRTSALCMGLCGFVAGVRDDRSRCRAGRHHATHQLDQKNNHAAMFTW
ncbi:MAG: hypothetical protein ACP5QA_16375, partial [Phycisphaerae bacterium]